MKSSRRPSPHDAFASLHGERERAADLFGIDIEASFAAWMEDMLGEDGATRLRAHLRLPHPRYRRQPVPFALADLSEREREILSLVACGYTQPEVAEMLFIATETVKSHMRRVYGKLSCRSSAQAAITAALIGELNTEVVEAHLFRALPGFASPRTPIAA